jgi:hypothetical protein
MSDETKKILAELRRTNELLRELVLASPRGQSFSDREEDQWWRERGKRLRMNELNKRERNVWPTYEEEMDV